MFLVENLNHSHGHFTLWPRAVTRNWALETHPQALPWKIEIEIFCGHGPSCVHKTHTLGLSTKCYFSTILLMWAFPR